jgi:hypothetical protein
MRELGRAAAAEAADPFGPGDPLDVARLVRRCLAAAGRKALDVSDVVVVASTAPAPVALARFTRRALGPRGAVVRTTVHALPDATHPTREAAAVVVATSAPKASAGAGVVIAVCLGPGRQATAICLAP